MGKADECGLWELAGGKMRQECKGKNRTKKIDTEL